ncbi:MAG: aminodeoxychorismate synthase component I [Alphaproteobacteria bacterium]
MTTPPPVALPVPYRDPVAAFAPLAGEPHAILLDSAAEPGRYTYLAETPFRIVTADEEGVRVDGARTRGDPFSVLASEMARHRRSSRPDLPPFQGGAVGVFGYELGRYLERLPPPHPADLGWPDMVVGLYDTLAAFDLREERAWVFADTEVKAQTFADKLASSPPLPELEWNGGAGWRAETDRSAYLGKVRQAKEWIAAGDIFQVNLSQRFITEMPAAPTPFQLYRRLRSLNPAPFSAWIGGGHGRALLSASPEQFLRLDPAGRLETRPIKGTRPRAADPAADLALARELVESPKDRAENLMIVDLLRNDLAKVCRLGSIAVPQLCRLESFATVHHLVSVVTGHLRPGLSAVDVLRATFPGGSITGCPKIRAMEILHEMEPVRRGPYCGAAAWLGFDGAMDASILIRSLVLGNGRVAAQAGGGIVADSDEAAEYEETLTKITPLLRALEPRP